GGPGIMEAANRGALDVKAKSIGLNIVLPHEQSPNPYISPELCFEFHYFAIRKMHFLIRSRALVCFPGGYGTLDELFEALTLLQTKKIKPIPLLLFGKQYWSKLINFKLLVSEGMICPSDLKLFHYVETAEQAWKIIAKFYDLPM
ncbi:MAG: LOG family protein, partial [Cellulomonas sp.]|nr:LOG family protein [Rickettsiella sp.]